jgi:hypothetical protein
MDDKLLIRELRIRRQLADMYVLAKGNTSSSISAPDSNDHFDALQFQPHPRAVW